MSVTRTSNPGKTAVDLALSRGEYLAYHIPRADSNVLYTLESNTGEIILTSADCPAPCTRRWPDGDSPLVPGQEAHTLGMQFFGEESLLYEVERRAADGTLLEQVKICAFRNTGLPDDYYEPLRVFLT